MSSSPETGLYNPSVFEVFHTDTHTHTQTRVHMHVLMPEWIILLCAGDLTFAANSI